MELLVSLQIHAQRSILTFHINYVNYQQYYCLFTDKKKVQLYCRLGISSGHLRNPVCQKLSLCDM